MNEQPTETATSAVASLILGILSPLCFGFLTGIPAAICGHIALSRIRNTPLLGGKGMAIAGLVTGYVGIFVSPMSIVLFLLLLSSRAAAPFIYTLF